MRSLKQLWDLIYLIRSRIDEWTKTAWKEVNIESIDQELRQTYLNKELRSLSKECNQWNAYHGIEKEVKNLVASLRSVGEFRNNAIRSRHWEELMKETGVQIHMTDETSLQDLLILNLHKYEEEVFSLFWYQNKNIDKIFRSKILLIKQRKNKAWRRYYTI